ncbi:MAG: hypothetical protein QM533_05430 [Cytophagales bacterium]|nr:hypothetical protein [Cytophagales bacterium]
MSKRHSGADTLVDIHVLGVEAAFAKTRELMEVTSPQPIFEAGFKADAVGDGVALAFADVLFPGAKGTRLGRNAGVGAA